MDQSTDIGNNPYGDEQRAVIVSLAKTEFDVENPTHTLLLTSVRNKLAIFLPHHALASLRVHIDMSSWLAPNSTDSSNFSD